MLKLKHYLFLKRFIRNVALLARIFEEWRREQREWNLKLEKKILRI